MSEKTVNWLHKLLLMVSYSAIICLTVEFRTHLLPTILKNYFIALFVILIIPNRFVRISLSPRPNWWQITTMVLFSALFFFSFRSSWISFYKFKPFIERFGRWWPLIICSVAVFGIAFSLPMQWKLVHLGRSVLERMEKASEENETAIGKIPMRVLHAAFILLLVFLQFYIMQYSLIHFPKLTFGMVRKYYLLNIVLILAVSLLLVLFLQRWRYALLVSTVLFIAWGFSNHYVLLLHGSPLYLAELANTKTAFEVVANYSISLGEIPWSVVALSFYTCVILHTFWIMDRRYGTLSWKIFLARLLLLGAFSYPIYSTLLAKNAKVINGARPTYYASRYGFVCVAAADAAKSMHPIIEPEGYSPEKLPAAVPVEAVESSDYPDIIMILNETFCDLDYYTTINADSDYLAPFYGVEGAFYGHAATPAIGGGTNNSEYELLTGFPYYLVASYAPFNYLNFEKINSNAVQDLKRLGYYTAGMHYYNRENYHRSTAYPALGFDDCILGPPEDLPDISYGHRGHLDSTYYHMLEGYYNSYPEDQPRFIYMLTFQNHGGYTRNDASLDTVHAGTNFGLTNDPLNEFLTSVSQSAEAFAELVDYYSRVDRKVVICMVGDHAPSFIQGMQTDKKWNGSMESIAQHIVPYVVWSNYGADLSGCSEYINIFGLIPQLVSVTGLPITQYYKAVTEMQKDFPIFLSTGQYMDSQGETGTYNVNNHRYDVITSCLYMGYNSLIHGDDFVEALYLPQ